MKENYFKGLKVVIGAYKRLNIGSKLIILYIFLLFLPGVLSTYYVYNRSYENIEAKVADSLMQALQQAEINISYRLENAKKISDLMYSNYSVSSFLEIREEEQTLLGRVRHVQGIQSVVEGAQRAGDLYKIRIFVKHKTIYPSQRNILGDIKDIQDACWLQDVLNAKGQVTWIDTRKETYYDIPQANVITCARVIYDPVKWETVNGIVTVDISEEAIFSILSQIEFVKKNNIFISDKNGTFVSHYDKSLIGQQVSDYLYKKIDVFNQGIETVTESGKKSFLIYRTIPQTGWKIVMLVPVRDVIGENAALNNMSAIFISIITFMGFVLAAFLIFTIAVKKISDRIKNLTNHVEEVGIQSYQQNKGKDQNDILRLENNVNRLITVVEGLTQESYKAKISEREAQLKALQAQINPHFLYNTLDTINWMAIQKKATDISRMVDSLAKYFRFSLNKGKDLIKVEDEIKLAQVYLDIQRERYKDSFSVVFDVDEKVKSYYMPKLTLQPIVENALLHGIQKKKVRTGTITIQAKMKGEDIVFVISDDGVGMKDETANQILSDDFHESKTKSYGLYNVNQRIRLFSGEEYGLRIHSVVGEGTSVTILMKGAIN